MLRVALAPNLSPPPQPPAYSPRPSPKRGGRPEVCQRLGGGRRLRAGVTPRSREASGTALGVIRPLREELARVPRRPAPWRNGTRRGEEPTWRRGSHGIAAARPGRAARSPKSPKAERHGACGRWLNPSAPLPGSTEADCRSGASRRSASPVLSPPPRRNRPGGTHRHARGLGRWPGGMHWRAWRLRRRPVMRGRGPDGGDRAGGEPSRGRCLAAHAVSLAEQAVSRCAGGDLPRKRCLAARGQTLRRAPAGLSRRGRRRASRRAPASAPPGRGFRARGTRRACGPCRRSDRRCTGSGSPGRR